MHVSTIGGKIIGMAPESREDIINAIEAKDYDAWKAAVSDRLTEDNFNTLVERHEAMSEQREQRDDVMEAIEAGDYAAFQVAADNTPIISRIQDEDDFEILVQLHQAKQDGDYEKVRELSEQLGLSEWGFEEGDGKEEVPGPRQRVRSLCLPELMSRS
jgi:hypothetical protein